MAAAEMAGLVLPVVLARFPAGGSAVAASRTHSAALLVSSSSASSFSSFSSFSSSSAAAPSQRSLLARSSVIPPLLALLGADGSLACVALDHPDQAVLTAAETRQAVWRPSGDAARTASSTASESAIAQGVSTHAPGAAAAVLVTLTVNDAVVVHRMADDGQRWTTESHALQLAEVRKALGISTRGVRAMCLCASAGAD
jgi:hypothetical protein